jgi:hypothetical protein
MVGAGVAECLPNDKMAWYFVGALATVAKAICWFFEGGSFLPDFV